MKVRRFAGALVLAGLFLGVGPGARATPPPSGALLVYTSGAKGEIEPCG